MALGTGTVLLVAQLWFDISRDADADRRDLSRAAMARSDLSQSKLQDVDLSGAHVVHSDLSGADLDQTNLAGARLGNSDLEGAQFFNVELAGTDLNNANLSNTVLRGFTASLSSIEPDYITAGSSRRTRASCTGAARAWRTPSCTERTSPKLGCRSVSAALNCRCLSGLPESSCLTTARWKSASNPFATTSSRNGRRDFRLTACRVSSVTKCGIHL